MSPTLVRYSVVYRKVLIREDIVLLASVVIQYKTNQLSGLTGLRQQSPIPATTRTDKVCPILAWRPAVFDAAFSEIQRFNQTQMQWMFRNVSFVFHSRQISFSNLVLCQKNKEKEFLICIPSTRNVIKLFIFWSWSGNFVIFNTNIYNYYGLRITLVGFNKRYNFLIHFHTKPD